MKCDKCKKRIKGNSGYSDVMFALGDKLKPNQDYCYLFCGSCEVEKEKMIIKWLKVL